MDGGPRVLLIAEAANPEWVSVPLVGWSHALALRDVCRPHVVTQLRNRAAIERFGWREGVEFTALDTERVAGPVWRFDDWLRRRTGLGWTVSTALSSLPYIAFERAVWKRFGPALRRGEFDLVHRLTPLTPTTPSGIAKRCRRIGVPFVWGPLNGGVPWPPEFLDARRAEREWLSAVRDAHKLLPSYRSTRRSAAATILGSISTWEDFTPYHERCVYIPENGIDPGRFATQSADDATKPPLRVVFVGRLVPYKGADMLLDALSALVRDAKVVVDIIGDGPERGPLEQLVEREGLTHGVRLHGWVSHDVVRERLAESHVLGFPSVREFGGGVVLEAMAMGVVPVVADYGGPAELVTPDTGFRVPIGPRTALVRELREVFERLVADPAPLQAMSERARDRVRTLFTWEAKARQVAEVYEWVLGRRSKPSFGMPFPEVAETGTVTETGRPGTATPDG